MNLLKWGAACKQVAPEREVGKLVVGAASAAKGGQRQCTNRG